MKHLKKSYILLVLLTLLGGSRTFAQEYFAKLNNKLEEERIRKRKEERAKEVLQDNEYTTTGAELGNFFSNPLMLNGKPVDYGVFSLHAKGELTVIKGSVITRDTTQVPFHVYLRRNGKKIFIPGKERPNSKQTKIDISEILNRADPDDLLVIEPVNREDGPAKRILKLLGGGC